ncbi:nuclear transport factor 2 family protein [Frankia sp. AiPs1]|uniref:nuclear transport factor 2 family protein n=1 Tax=Frankia sp. AiPs1 TaxID=573493 RepID=UPI0020435E63|nr:nuclear transport factor 2 family protein [Frankia sp. AiPs1]MCM3922139.1 nuclear transport factor 2 family protein [Frankia sp. AiPs1]
MTRSPDLVIPRIFAAIDDHRFDDLPAYYTAEVQADTAVGHIRGRDQLVATLRAIHEPVAVLQHLVTGVIVDPHGDDADVRANVVATFCDAEHRPTLEGASVWRGRLRRCDDDWQVSEYSLDLVWSRGSMPTTWGVSATAPRINA